MEQGTAQESSFWASGQCAWGGLTGVFGAASPALETPSGEAAKKSLGELLCFAKPLTPVQRRGETKLSS